MDVSERDIRRLNNNLSIKAVVSRFYVDNDGDLMCEAWFPGKFSATHFGVFLRAWNRDTEGVHARRHPSFASRGRRRRAHSSQADHASSCRRLPLLYIAPDLASLSPNELW